MALEDYAKRVVVLTNAAEASATNPIPTGGIVADLVATPTVSAASIYADGDLVGGKITLASAVRAAGAGGVIQAITLTDLAKQSAAIDVIFFNADPSTTTFTDNAAFDVADAELVNIIGIVKLAAADYAAFNDSSAICKTGINLPFVLAGTSLYAALVTRGTPTYAATTDVKLRVTVQQN
jgi:hypothetical protein